MTLTSSKCTYDLVISNGRVMDPETGFDKIANVGIVGDKIKAISEQSLQDTEKTIDANGLIVAPGFIEIHTHGVDNLNYGYRAMDGITMMLETELGTVDVDEWYAERDGKTLVHHGVCVGHGPVRVEVMKGEYHGFHFSGPARTDMSSKEEIDEIVSLIRRGLSRGALGVGLVLQYTPGATEEEITRVFEETGEASGAACYVHLRYIGLGTKDKPSSITSLEEILKITEKTKVPLQVAHITSSGLKATPKLLEMIGEARAKGFDVRSEFYPYTAAMTGINSTWFDPGWQEVLGISYDRLQWPVTGEFLTEETFSEYQHQYKDGEVIIHMIPKEAFEAAVKSPFTMVISDGLLFPNLVGHPRSAGSCARVLGRLVREEKTLTMMEALRKMTLMPAQRIEARVPEMKKKGRVQVGADADLVVFDPEQVIDKATFENPAQYSEGVQYVLVAGAPIVSEGKLQSGVAPGRAVRAPIAEENTSK